MSRNALRRSGQVVLLIAALTIPLTGCDLEDLEEINVSLGGLTGWLTGSEYVVVDEYYYDDCCYDDWYYVDYWYWP